VGNCPVVAINRGMTCFSLPLAGVRSHAEWNIKETFPVFAGKATKKWCFQGFVRFSSTLASRQEL
jgi:hypothetical protein